MCTGCTMARATLSALEPIPAGTPITVRVNPSPPSDPSCWPFEITFDGASGRTGERHFTCAAGCLWKRDAAGYPPTLLRVATVLLPDDTQVPEAEALGCRIGLELLGSADPRLAGAPRRVRVSGDNTAAIRFGASQGRLLRLPMHGTLNDGIARATAGGWLLDWQLIRRRANGVANGFARRAARREALHPGSMGPAGTRWVTAYGA